MNDDKVDPAPLPVRGPPAPQAPRPTEPGPVESGPVEPNPAEPGAADVPAVADDTTDDLLRGFEGQQIGHYFDQTVFDLHYALLMARARRLSLEAELAAQGIAIDPASGAVRLEDRDKAKQT